MSAENKQFKIFQNQVDQYFFEKDTLKAIWIKE